MQVDHDIAHLGIVDGALGLAPPRLLGGGVAVVDPNQVDLVEIDEVEATRILDPSAEHQVKLAHALPLSVIGRNANRQSLLRTASAAALAEARAASVAPSKMERIVCSPFSRVSPSSLRRDVPVSRAASTAALAVLRTRLTVGRRALVSIAVRGSKAAISAPAAIPPANASNGASLRPSAALRPASATPPRAFS